MIQHEPSYIRRLSRGLIICLVCSVISSNLAFTGEYHNPKERTFAKTTETLACSQCHTMHGTQGGQSLIYGGTNAVYPRLLRQANILQLCLFCHSNDQAGMCPGPPCPPDVWSGSGGGAVTTNSAGRFCAGGSAIANPPCSDATINHTIDVNANVTPPGWAGATPLFTPATGGLTCINCHNQHGTTNYRNLRNNSYRGVDFTGVNVSYKMGAGLATTPDTTVFVNNTVDAGFGLTKYQTDKVKYIKAPVTAATDGIQAFCKACHNKFHYAGGENATEMSGSASGDTAASTTDTWLRHPTMDVSIGEGQINLHVAESSVWSGRSWFPRMINPDGVQGNGDEIPFCFSCHRVHGSTNHSNLIFGDPATSVGGAGTMMRDTCLQCHDQ